jgi:trans-2,3-dihydro-3-hydroxyanthranilate isomerase
VEFFQVDVFADAPFEGNPLAVFPDAQGLSKAQMQAIAREMNLSETAFVGAVQDDSYDVRIFTPEEELSFAGHPTIGTAWVLHDLGRVKGDDVVQRSRAGDTRVFSGAGDGLWFERMGESEVDLEARETDAPERAARALGLDVGRIGLEARELGRPGRLGPAFSDAGVRQLIVPLRDVASLEACRPRADILAELTPVGAYCFTALGAGRIRARGFFPSLGITEDPATGSGAAALGLYLVARLGPVDVELRQGVEMGRPSRILLRAEGATVQVGGRCHLVLSGRLERLP